MSILRLQGYRCSMNHAFTYSPMWNKRMLQPLKWMRNLILILYVVIALAQANKLRPAPIVPNPLLCTGRSRFPHNHIHHIHPSFLILKRNTSVLKTFVLATECSIRLFYQENFRPFKYIRHFRQFCRTSFLQSNKRAFSYACEQNAQGNQQSSTGVFSAGRGLLTARS